METKRVRRRVTQEELSNSKNIIDIIEKPCMTTYHQDRFKNKQNLLELFKEKEHKEYCNILDKVSLQDFQTFTVKFLELQKKALISIDTGMGKTLIATAIARLFSLKTIWITKLDALDQLISDVSKYAPEFKIKTVSSKYTELIPVLTEDVLRYDILAVTYEVVRDMNFFNFMLYNIKHYSYIVFDEAHKLGNKDSEISQICKRMFARVPYVSLLTATPITISPVQAIDILYSIDDYYADFRNYFVQRDMITNQVVGTKNLDKMDYVLLGRYVSFTRKEKGIRGNHKPILDIVKPMLGQEHEEIKEIRLGNNQLQSAYNFCDNLRGYKGIIYCNLNKSKEALFNYLSDFRVGFIDGKFNKTRKGKTEVKEAFLAGELEIIITNSVECLNLPCDYIYFYEMTVLWKQLIGRGERGLSPKDLTLGWSVTANTKEVNFFYKNIYKRGIILEEGFKKDISELKSWEVKLREIM